MSHSPKGPTEGDWIRVRNCGGRYFVLVREVSCSLQCQILRQGYFASAVDGMSHPSVVSLERLAVSPEAFKVANQDRPIFFLSSFSMFRLLRIFSGKLSASETGFQSRSELWQVDPKTFNETEEPRPLQKPLASKASTFCVCAHSVCPVCSPFARGTSFCSRASTSTSAPRRWAAYVT